MAVGEVMAVACGMRRCALIIVHLRQSVIDCLLDWMKCPSSSFCARCLPTAISSLTRGELPDPCTCDATVPHRRWIFFENPTLRPLSSVTIV